MKRKKWRSSSKHRAPRTQANQYDRIITEAYGTSPENFVLCILADILKGKSNFRVLSVKFERTLERIGDFLFRAIDNETGEKIIVHLEFQSKYDSTIKFRLYLYSAMIAEREGQMPLQYVIYFGEDEVPSLDGLDGGIENHFRFEVIRIIDFAPELFLNSNRPMEVIFAILCKTDDPKGLIRKILARIDELTDNEKERRRLFRMFVNLARFRNLDELVKKEDKMSLAKLLVENDVVYVEASKKLKDFYEPKITTLEHEKEEYKQKAIASEQKAQAFEQKYDFFWNVVRNQVLALYSENKSIEEISTKFGLSTELVNQIITPFGGHSNE